MGEKKIPRELKSEKLNKALHINLLDIEDFYDFWANNENKSSR